MYLLSVIQKYTYLEIFMPVLSHRAVHSVEKIRYRSVKPRWVVIGSYTNDNDDSFV